MRNGSRDAKETFEVPATRYLHPLRRSKESKVDVRIICATNRDPLQEVAEGRFREDLYYRVHVIPIDMPALRERGKDITILASHFLRQYSRQDGKRFTKLSAEVERLFQGYEWPGNVRQLQNVMRNIVVLNDDTEVKLEYLPSPLNKLVNKGSTEPTAAPTEVTVNIEPAVAPVPVEQDVPATTEQVPEPIAAEPEEIEIKPMWLVERETIQQAIKHCDGNVLNAAVLLDLSPATIYRKKQQWEAQAKEQ